MIWLNITALENKITANELSEKDGFNYVLAYFILSSILMATMSNDSSALIKLLNAVVSVVVLLWGLHACYTVNNENDGKDFLKRFFAISWVIGLRILLAIVVVSFVSALVFGILTGNQGFNNWETNPVKELVYLVFTATINVIMYLMVINSFRNIKSKSQI